MKNHHHFHRTPQAKSRWKTSGFKGKKRAWKLRNSIKQVSRRGKSPVNWTPLSYINREGKEVDPVMFPVCRNGGYSIH